MWIRAMQKKVIFLITKSVWGGAQRYVYDLATSLPKDQFSVLVVAGGNGALIEKLGNADIRTSSLPTLQMDNKLGDVLFSFVNISALAGFLRMFRKEEPDIIHLNSSKVGGLGAVAGLLYKIFFKPKGKNPKIIFTVHGWAFNEPRNQFARAIIYSLQWLNAAICDRVILISKNDYREGLSMPFFKKTKFVLIPLGIKPLGDNMLAKQAARKKLRDNFQIDFGESPIIGTIAEFTENKGLVYLLEAASKLKMLGFNCATILIGSGKLEAELKKRATELGIEKNIFLTGFIKDAWKYLKCFDVFVLPSLKEGLPYTIIEAMAAGVPVVASSVGGVPDLIINDQSGKLVPAKNSDRLSEAIKELISDKNKSNAIIRNARMSFNQKFLLENMLLNTTKIYDNA